MGKLELNPEQDGLGFYYGRYVTDDGTHVRVDVLPPHSHPKPWFVMETNAAAHETDWIIYADGQELARVSRRDDIEAVAVRCLDAAPQA